jgi:hypothetical protein
MHRRAQSIYCNTRRIKYTDTLEYWSPTPCTIAYYIVWVLLACHPRLTVLRRSLVVQIWNIL